MHRATEAVDHYKGGEWQLRAHDCECESKKEVGKVRSEFSRIRLILFLSISCFSSNLVFSIHVSIFIIWAFSNCIEVSRSVKLCF
jgi:hypothetical protein